MNIVTNNLHHINWGIIGCGEVTEVKSGPAFNKVAHSKLTAVMRRDGLKAADYAKRHGVPKWYTDAEDLINDPEVNAIYVATPPSTHLQYALAAISAGKPVYVEKPMAMNFAEANRMAAFAKEKNVKISVAHYRRQMPLFLKIKSLIEEKKIGDIRFVALQLLQSAAALLVANTGDSWRTNPKISGGGLFHDLAPHQIDLMLYLFGNAELHHGFSVNQSKAHLSDDIVCGSILFEKNILFNGIWCFNVSDADAKDNCTIYGSKGNIQFSFFGNSLSITINGQTEQINFDPLPHVQEPMIAKVVNYFLGKDENPCSADIGVETMLLLDRFSKGI